MLHWLSQHRRLAAHALTVPGHGSGRCFFLVFSPSQEFITVCLPLLRLLEAGRATTRKVLWGGNLPAAVEGFFDLCQIGANGPEKAPHKAQQRKSRHFSGYTERNPFPYRRDLRVIQADSRTREIAA